MDVGMNQLVPDFLYRLYQDCCAQPNLAKGLIQKHISKNRSLSSKLRKSYQEWMMQGLRWENVYMDIPHPSNLKDYEDAINAHVKGLRQVRLDSCEKLSVQYNFPLWLVELLSKSRSLAEVQGVLDSFQCSAKVYLRMNVFRMNEDTIVESLQKDEVSFVKADLPYCLEIKDKVQINKTHAYKKGWVEVQDYGSQFIVDQMELGPKLNIIDGCCRTGGKALAMCNYTKDQSTIHGVDVDARVFDEMKKRLHRAKVTNVKTHWVGKDETSPLSEFNQKADRVLVDAPCSSVGTLKRRPWLRNQLTPAKIQAYANQQVEILLRQSKWVKQHGLLVYSVCSILTQETKEVIDKFLQRTPEFSFQHEKTLLPDQTGGDGFYFCVLKK